MKKKKKMIALMVVIVLAALAVCVRSVRNSSKQTLTITDPDGMTYLAILDQNNNVYAGITDPSGNLYGARIDSDGYPVLDESLYVVGEYTGTLPRNNTTAVDIQQTNSGTTYNYNAEVSIVEDTDSKSSTKADKSNNSSSSEKAELMSEKYLKLFASGTYFMKFTSTDPDIPGEIIMAFKGGSIYLETTVEGIPAEVIYNDATKQGAIVIKQFRTYCTLPDDMIAEMSGGAIDVEKAMEYDTVKTYKVDINGRECICESFTYADGDVKNYYFYNKELVRMDFIEPDGSSTIYNISEISSNVPDSYFEMPKGYIKLDMAKVLENYDEE